MSMNLEFLDERARAATAEAEQATLDNVRERALRSAAAWTEMADRARVIEHDRKLAAKVREARIAAEQELAEG
jgi:hypothetical protein